MGADRLAGVARRADHAAHPVHLRDREAGVQRDAMVCVPLPVVQNDVIKRLFVRQYGREQGAVVIRMWLGAEHGDVVQTGRYLEQFFQRAHSSHAIAHHHQPTFVHRELRWRLREIEKVGGVRRSAAARWADWPPRGGSFSKE